jgi:hypothetical protein
MELLKLSNDKILLFSNGLKIRIKNQDYNIIILNNGYYEVIDLPLFKSNKLDQFINDNLEKIKTLYRL